MCTKRRIKNSKQQINKQWKLNRSPAVISNTWFPIKTNDLTTLFSLPLLLGMLTLSSRVFFFAIISTAVKKMVVLPNRKDWSKLRFFGVCCHNIISFYFCSWRINKPLTGKTLSTVVSIKWSIAQKYYLIHIHLFEQFSMIGSINLINIFPLPCTSFLLIYMYNTFVWQTLCRVKSISGSMKIQCDQCSTLIFIICVLIGF